MQNQNPINQTELEAGLARLGIRELEERMEISPLLLLGEGDSEMESDFVCCTCKVPNPVDMGKDGLLPNPFAQEDLLAPMYPGMFLR